LSAVRGSPVIISEKWKFIFVHLHKTAGDAITEAMMPLLGERDVIIKGSVSESFRRSLPFSSEHQYRMLYKHSTAAAIRAAVPAEVWDNYYKFAFVRNPVDRAVSMYKYGLTMRDARQNAAAWRHALFQTPVGVRFDPLNWPAVKAAAECDSFSSFLRHEDAMRDLGMQPQVRSLSDPRDGKIIVDAVGKFEDLESDFEKIRKEIGLPEISLHRVNVSKRRKVPVPEAELALLRDRYKDDMTEFGYIAE
jgi:hypothetical protein